MIVLGYVLAAMQQLVQMTNVETDEQTVELEKPTTRSK